MSHSASWKEHLADRIPVGLGREIDAFETQMHLRRQGKITKSSSPKPACAGAPTASATTKASASTGLRCSN